MSQRREHFRRMLQVTANVYLTSPSAHYPVHLIDVSKAGVAFASSRSLDSGTVFILTLRLPGRSQPTLAEGTTVYCLGPGDSKLYRIGARFTHLSDEALEQIRNFVSAPPA